MDALKNLTNNIPDWLTRLDELSSQVDKRQAELAAIAAAEPNNSSETKSLRNKGSAESLKPKDDGPSNIPAPDEPSSNDPHRQQQQERSQQPSKDPTSQSKKQPGATQDAQKPAPVVSSSGPGGMPSSPKPPRDAAGAANTRASAQAKKRVRSPSMLSADNAPKAYRTRSMIIVYYDSYVQGFFDNLVRFVSSSRNLMRKAKMAARVAQIKKLAEAEVSNGDGDGEGRDGADPLPSLRYMSSRRMGPIGIGRPGFGPPGANEKPDVYDNLDKGLEFVQSTCEHGAHQFLRDADCNDEIRKIQDRLRKVLEMALKEIERILVEEPELAKETGELTKPRACRPISIRRELSASSKDNGGVTREETTRLDAAKPARSAHSKSSFIEPATQPIEVDTTMSGEEVDLEAELPKLQYRSTRGMRNRVC
ncbi:hypothetical protein ACO1O0_004498 [Amphichorda felina]